jgi:hypothetical protein
MISLNKQIDENSTDEKIVDVTKSLIWLGFGIWFSFKYSLMYHWWRAMFVGNV